MYNCRMSKCSLMFLFCSKVFEFLHVAFHFVTENNSVNFTVTGLCLEKNEVKFDIRQPCTQPLNSFFSHRYVAEITLS